MKKIIGFLILLASLSCSSNFDFDTSPRQEYTYDEDGDPVIENPDNTDTNGLGLAGGYCYGNSLPDAEIAEIDLEIDFPMSYDISGFLPVVRNQGNQGSCVAWATGYYLKSFHENYEDILDGVSTNHEMSPAFIYNQIKVAGCDEGSNVQRALDTLSASGIPAWDVMPYDENDCATQPDEIQKTLAIPNKIKSYHYLDQDKVFEQTKAFLYNDQPVVIAIAIDRNYFGARDENGIYIYRKFKESSGGHAMLVVGYDDEMNAFKVVNSWGEGWEIKDSSG